MSLRDLVISLSKDQKLPTSETDNLCNICEDGDLLICDICLGFFQKGKILCFFLCISIIISLSLNCLLIVSFHFVEECVGILEIPQGDLYCHWCKNLLLRGKHGCQKNNTCALLKIANVEPIEQIH